MTAKGFKFIGSNIMRNNAFFVKKILLDSVKLDLINDSEIKKFTKVFYREGRDKKGNLTYENSSSSLEKIKNCEVYDIKNHKISKIKDLVWFSKN